MYNALLSLFALFVQSILKDLWQAAKLKSCSGLDIKFLKILGSMIIVGRAKPVDPLHHQHAVVQLLIKCRWDEQTLPTLSSHYLTATICRLTNHVGDRILYKSKIVHSTDFLLQEIINYWRSRFWVFQNTSQILTTSLLTPTTQPADTSQ